MTAKRFLNLLQVDIILITMVLTDEQKKIMFEKQTEPPFSGKLLHNKEKGTYHCANCSTILFRSETKFDSGTGWPSFRDAENVEFREDHSHGMNRIEVLCRKCRAHLGHVFDEPEGKRYCINSLCLDFRK